MSDATPECFVNLAQRKAVLAALLEVLKEKPLGSVKTDELCARCGISRTSFYRYFSGVKDIARWYQSYGAELGMHKIGLTLDCVSGHRVSLELIARAYPMYRDFVHFWNHDYSLAAVRGQCDAMRDVLVRRGIEIDPVRTYELEGVSFSCHETVSSWINRGMDVPARRLAELLASFYPPELRKILDDPLDPSGAVDAATELLAQVQPPAGGSRPRTSQSPS